MFPPGVVTVNTLEPHNSPFTSRLEFTETVDDKFLFLSMYFMKTHVFSRKQKYSFFFLSIVLFTVNKGQKIKVSASLGQNPVL